MLITAVETARTAFNRAVNGHATSPRQLRRIERRRRSSDLDSRNRRDRIARTDDLRRTLRLGSRLAAALSLATAFTLSTRFPATATPLFLLWVSAAAASVALSFVSDRAPQRSILALTVLFTVIPSIALFVTAFEADAPVSMASGFIMLPVAVPLFLAWTTSVRTAWLAVYAAVFGGTTLITGFGHLGTGQRMDALTSIAIGVLIGWVGGEMLERLRERTLEQESELRRLNRVLLVRAATDALTGLANRRQLETDLQMLGTPGASGTCSFIMLDLDRFKRLNDQLGHAAGDAALRSVSAEFRRVIRERDTIYRYGGEEFLVIMRGSSIEAAAETAERIRAAIADLQIVATIGPPATHLTISCGVASASVPRKQWEAVLAAADSALYEAKAGGGNRVSVVPVNAPRAKPPVARDRRRASTRRSFTARQPDAAVNPAA